MHQYPWHANVRPPSHLPTSRQFAVALISVQQLLCSSVQTIMADTREGGERIIAASRRPDGTLRKERKIRPGFVPQEEQQVYVSRGAAVSKSNARNPHLSPVFIPAIAASLHMAAHMNLADQHQPSGHCWRFATILSAPKRLRVHNEFAVSGRRKEPCARHGPSSARRRAAGQQTQKRQEEREAEGKACDRKGSWRRCARQAIGICCRFHSGPHAAAQSRHQWPGQQLRSCTSSTCQPCSRSRRPDGNRPADQSTEEEGERVGVYRMSMCYRTDHCTGRLLYLP